MEDVLDDVIGVVLGVVALVALIVGMAWMVHADAKGPCTHTLAGEKCALIDTSAQR